MKIQIFDVIKQGIVLSFKDKKILTLIILWSIFWIIFSPLIVTVMTVDLRDLIEAVYLPALLAFILVIFLVISSPILTYAITKAAFENLNKREISIPDAVVSVLKKFIPLFVASIIYFAIPGFIYLIALIVPGIFLFLAGPHSIVLTLGFIAFTILIIPGIFLTVALFFYGHAILLNNKGIIASFKESYNIVKGNWWQLFILYLIFTIIAALLFGALSRFFALVLHPYLTDITNIIFTIAIYFTLGIGMVVYTIVYFQLIGKEKKIEEDIKTGKVVQEKSR